MISGDLVLRPLGGRRPLDPPPHPAARKFGRTGRREAAAAAGCGVGEGGPAAHWSRDFAVSAVDERRLASERGIIIMHGIGIVASFQPE